MTTSRVFVTEAVGRYLRLHLETTVTRIDQNEDTTVTVSLDNGQVLDADGVVFATGRLPNTCGLGLEALGIRLNHNGAVLVDDKFETSVPGVYAVGDVIDRVTLTPVALAEGQALVRRLFASDPVLRQGQVSYELIPSAVFCDPQIATVGLTETQARALFPSPTAHREAETAKAHRG